MKDHDLNRLRPALALLPPVVAFIVQWIFWSAIQPLVWFLFYPAVLFSAWIGGFVPGLVSTFASAVIVWWFFIPPQFSFTLENPISLVSIGVFCIMGGFFSFTLGRMKELIKLSEETNDTLRTSEENLTVTLNSIGDAVMATDAEGCVTRLNSVAEQLTGWSATEAAGRPVGEIFRIINQETRLPATIPVIATLAHGTIQGLANHTVLIARDGSECAIADSCAPIRDRDGQVIGAVLVFRDVTGEYAVQQALRDSAALIQSILNAVVDGIITLHARGGIVETVNPAAERMFGYTAAELIGQKISLLIPELDRDQHNGNGSLEYYSTNEEARAIGLGREVAGRRKDGGIFPMEMAVSEMWQGGQRYFTGILRDVTARKQAEEARRTSEELFRIMFVQAPLGIAVINSLTGHIYEANPRFAEISGRSMEEMQNIDWMQITHPDDVQADLDNMALVQTGKTNGFQMEKRYIRPDGTTVWINMTIGSLKSEDKAQPRHLCMIQDITARKQAEADRAQLFQVLQDKNNELEHAMTVAEKANHTKDSFLATMSHEIRTPLTGMLGMLEVLSLTPLNHEQEEMVKATWDSSRSLLRIVSDILDWSKIEDGKLALAPQAASIPRLLQDVVNTYSRVASAKSLSLCQHVDSRLSEAHIVDSLRLSQVLNNFVSNAIKFTERGEIEVRAELLEQLESGEQIRFSVKDTGIGIAREAQQHLFQHYRQESTDTARMYGGTGLGLAICRRLVDLMDGQIELASEPGQGSIFSVTLILPVSGTSGEPLPILFSEMERTKVNPLFDGSEDAPLVLAVDDHPINRDLLVRQIKLLGLRVESAENGQVALSIWRDGRFALVITDCHMPEMDGYAFTRAVRKIEAEEARPRTPIIAWTANALAEEEQHCQAAGMDELLVKPADLTQLKKMLAKWLSLSETDSSQTTPSLHDADGGQTRGPIDYVELSRVVPDSAKHIQVLHDFQQHIRADRAKLIEMLEQGDQVNVERTAHRMKGSCRMVGATDMASACATIEQRAREGNMDTARAGMTGLDDAIKRFETYFAELTDSTGGNR